VLQGIKQAAVHVQQGSRQPVQGAHNQAAGSSEAAALYTYDPAVAGALDARAVAAGHAAEKHLQVVEGADSLCMNRCRKSQQGVSVHCRAIALRDLAACGTGRSDT
jgi:hypothetical protein